MTDTGGWFLSRGVVHYLLPGDHVSACGLYCEHPVPDDRPGIARCPRCEEMVG